MTGQRADTDRGTSAEDVEFDIDLVLGFLNTVDAEENTDILATGEGWRTWMVQRLLTPGPDDDPVDARRVRDALRAALDPGPRAKIATAAEPLGERLGVQLVAGVPALTGDGAVNTVLAAVVRLAVLGQWERVKICPASDCRWAFYDRSRNHSRTWCSMRVCGNREKARAFRERVASPG